ncbi:hypothetical protein [Haloferula sp.]|uniref:hypothetical protein n=1 Tax=Haloferula sp. TaxID=2497595 RepID=UPI003C7379E2
MSDQGNRNYWFPAKRYGWGWGVPSSWQGWVATLLYLLVIVGLAFVFDPAASVVPYLVSVFAASAVLLIICWKKGEPTKWRWGVDDNSR